MEIVFYDNNRNSVVRLDYAGSNKFINCNAIAKSTCFEFQSRIAFTENALTLFHKSLKSIYGLKEYAASLLSENGLFFLQLSCNELGHMNFTINIKDEQERSKVFLKFEADLSFIPEMLEQIDGFLKRIINDDVSKADVHKNIVLSRVSLSRIYKSSPKGNDTILLKINHSSFIITRNVEVTKDEEEKLLNDLTLYDESKRTMEFYPLGDFVHFSLIWNDKVTWINGSVSDYQFPYNSIDFNIPCQYVEHNFALH